MRRVTLLGMFALAACGTTISDIIPMGPNEYMVGANARTGVPTNAEIMDAAVKKATAYCESTGKQVRVTATQNTGTQGLTPRNVDVRFSCY